MNSLIPLLLSIRFLLLESILNNVLQKLLLNSGIAGVWGEWLGCSLEVVSDQYNLVCFCMSSFCEDFF